MIRQAAEVRYVTEFGKARYTTDEPSRVRLYDNTVLSLRLASGQDAVLKDDTVTGNTPVRVYAVTVMMTQ